MGNALLSCAGGEIQLPQLVLTDREDGGHLVVNPPREVWGRSELVRDELMLWSFLVAATGQAMLEVLPQLQDGCINYWEAGNWALNDLAPPEGPKNVRNHRRVHLHVFGRSRLARHSEWRWGESPRFPDYVDSRDWASKFEKLRSDECQAIKARVAILLNQKYGCRLDEDTTQ